MDERFNYRAERTNNKHIVYGLLSYVDNQFSIITMDNNKYFIDEKTIQKCIGLKDKNNQFIYIGDKLRHSEGKEFNVIFSEIKGVILSEINGSSEYVNGNPYWIDECEIIY